MIDCAFGAPGMPSDLELLPAGRADDCCTVLSGDRVWCAATGTSHHIRALFPLLASHSCAADDLVQLFLVQLHVFVVTHRKILLCYNAESAQITM